ncbi:J domain-containing protein [Stenotrophomonas sp. SY1]|uniref:J domain-containing protein n=1 Tax=Stenotrophomonas sp. SY1 TaxID=477235 RepID=UPI001E41ACF3|nr:J domain-containing protein [Stenotrophomonas sp. SY1]MCD9085296.1 J domain-containing protein [Stenotrophomonas sp. SY1]
MNWALEVLELEQGADERAIKRAYARLLRGNRPDDDPEAFQRLHEAYQTALQWHRYQQQFEAEAIEEQEQELHGSQAQPMLAPHDTPDPDTDLVIPDPQWTQATSAPALHAVPMAVIEDAPATPAAPAFQAVDTAMPLQRIDLDALVARVLDAAQAMSDVAFGQWLLACPELWSLSGKADAGALLLQRLYPGELAICAANFDQIATSFGWDEIGSDVDPDTLSAMRRAMHLRWVLQAGNESMLAQVLRAGDNGSVTQADAHRYRELLVRPRSRLQALCSAWNPALVDRMRAALQQLGNLGDTLPCPPLRAEQVQFWHEVTDESRITGNRALLGLMRGLMLSALWLLLPVVVYTMGAIAEISAGRGWPAAGSLLTLGGIGVGVVMLVGMGTLPWKLLWQRMLPLLIPGLAVIGIAIGRTEVRFIGSIFGGAALWIVTILVLRNFPSVARVVPMMLAIGLFFVAPFVTSHMKLSYAELTGGLALLIYGFERWRLRKR